MMKCYNCDHQLNKLEKQCPHCHAKLDKKDYDLPKTDPILKEITTIQEFARFIGLFYIKSIILLIISLISITVAIILFAKYHSRAGYMIGAFIFVITFSLYLEMRKVEIYYNDFKKGKNKYIILYPIKTEHNVIVCDASDRILNRHVLNQRLHAYDKLENKISLLRFNTFKFLHPQKLKLFYKKHKFYERFFNPKTRHFIKTLDYDDNSYVKLEGNVHGFLITNKGVITVYNEPKITRKYFKTDNKNAIVQ